MIRGTTPTHIFKLPFDTALIAKAKIIYAQDDNILFAKTTADCECGTDSLTVTLTQEETFLFDCKKVVQIQMRALTTSGTVMSTPIKLVSVDKCLDTEVMS